MLFFPWCFPPLDLHLQNSPSDGGGGKGCVCGLASGDIFLSHDTHVTSGYKHIGTFSRVCLLKITPPHILPSLFLEGCPDIHSRRGSLWCVITATWVSWHGDDDATKWALSSTHTHTHRHHRRIRLQYGVHSAYCKTKKR